MIKYVVTGDPVSHSRSPGMQNAAFEKLGMGRPYGRCHVTRESLPEFFAMAKKKLSGVNITVPHKENILPFPDEIDPVAALCRSVNTLDIRNGKVKGYSTDGYGLEQAVRKNFNIPSAGKSFCFIGCGGACRASAVHLAAEGAGKIFLANRTVEKAADIARIIAENFPACQVHFFALQEKKELEDAIASADVLIQSTSLGLKEEDPAPFDLTLLEANNKIAVFDTIYKNTKLLQAAAKLHLPCAGGRDMLIYQGAASFRIWTGMEPDIAAMNAGFDITPVTDGDGKE
jgi:shikimate dehydrogenase